MHTNTYEYRQARTHTHWGHGYQNNTIFHWYYKFPFRFGECIVCGVCACMQLHTPISLFILYFNIIPYVYNFISYNQRRNGFKLSQRKRVQVIMEKKETKSEWPKHECRFKNRQFGEDTIYVLSSSSSRNRWSKKFAFSLCICRALYMSYNYYCILFAI